MKALVYRGVGAKAWQDVAQPVLAADTDAVVRVDATTICGTDLHILKGDVPAMIDGRVIGHEAVGTVDAIGSAVKNIKVGDRVLVSCITSCGSCRFCREGRYGQCLGGGGWILGNEIDGTQAEYVRVPFADNSTHLVPAGVSDEEMLMLADILPTSYEVGALAGKFSLATWSRSSVRDRLVYLRSPRLGCSAPAWWWRSIWQQPASTLRKVFGADVTVNNGVEDPVAVVRDLTGGLGADVVIEAVGVPATFELAAELVRPVGHIANIGVHGKPVTLHLERLWSRDVTITTGLVDTSSIPTLLKLVASHHIDAERFVTHHFGFDDFIEAYDTFARATETRALKVVLTRNS